MTDDELKALVARTAVAQDRTDAQLAETAAQLAKTDAKLDRLADKLDRLAEMYGGVGNSQGAVAEEFYYNSLKADPVLGGVRFDFVDKNITRSHAGLEDEFDLLLVNGRAVFVVEVKYKAHPNDLRRLLDDKAASFRHLFPEYADREQTSRAGGLPRSRRTQARGLGAGRNRAAAQGRPDREHRGLTRRAPGNGVSERGRDRRSAATAGRMPAEIQNGPHAEMRKANRPHSDAPEPSKGLSQTARRYAAKAARMGIDNPEDLMGLRGRPAAAPRRTSAALTDQDVQAGARRPPVADVQDHGRVPAVVQRRAAGVAGLWHGNRMTPSRSGTRCGAAASSTS